MSEKISTPISAGEMYGLITTFYEEPRPGNPDDIRRGDLYLDQPVYLPARWGLRLSNIDPADQDDPTFELTGRTEDIFNHPPIKRLGIDAHEALIVHKAKWARPVIVLSDAENVDPLAAHGARANQTFLCAPIFGADQFPSSLRERIRAYEFPNLFYLPEAVRPQFDEGFIRLDYMQAIRRNDLRSRRCQLSGEARDALDEWIVHYVTGRLPADSLVADYRKEELEKLRAVEDSG